MQYYLAASIKGDLITSTTLGRAEDIEHELLRIIIPCLQEIIKRMLHSELTL
jgi:hypothetical protein